MSLSPAMSPLMPGPCGEEQWEAEGLGAGESRDTWRAELLIPRPGEDEVSWWSPRAPCWPWESLKPSSRLLGRRHRASHVVDEETEAESHLSLCDSECHQEVGPRRWGRAVPGTGLSSKAPELTFGFHELGGRLQVPPGTGCVSRKPGCCPRPPVTAFSSLCRCKWRPQEHTASHSA